MTGKGLLKRIGMTLALSAGLFIFLSAIHADATPIRPDIRKVVAESGVPTPQLAPARAGWDGPELPRREAAKDPALDPAVTLRSNEAALITAAIPDPRAVLAVIVVIFLMRRLKNIQEERRQPAMVTSISAPKERFAA